MVAVRVAAGLALLAIAAAACAPIAPTIAPIVSIAPGPTTAPSANPTREPVIETRCFFQARDVLGEFITIDSVLDRYPSADADERARQDERLRLASSAAWRVVRHAGDACFAPERWSAFEGLAIYLSVAGTVPIDVARTRELMHATGIDICVLLEECPTPAPAGS